MSKIALSGDASGTGTFTIASPNSNSNYTLTLPTATGTVQVSGSAILGTTGTFTGLLDISAAGAGQIQFPATANLSSNANTLDDYEEGTWTPGLQFNGTPSSGAVYTSRDGVYTKIGRVVFLQALLVWTNKGSGTGVWQISGLPFPTLSTPNGAARSAVGVITNWQRALWRNFRIIFNPDKNDEWDYG
jgi:hypothetical protein